VTEPASPTTPVDVDIVRDRAVTIRFEDGEVCVFDVGELRRWCPCASCRGQREKGMPSWPRPGGSDTVAVARADLVGAWGLSIDWDDGHSTGIYAWQILRRWWDRGMAEPMVAEPWPEDQR
jgi:DUF971 family protein